MANWPRDTQLAVNPPPPCDTVPTTSLSVRWGGHTRGGGYWKKCHKYLSSSVLLLSLPSSTQAEHTPMHTTPLRAARLSFITLADESGKRLKINVTERRRPDSQPASSCRSEKGGRFKRSQPWIVKTRNIKHICKSAELLFFLSLSYAS